MSQSCKDRVNDHFQSRIDDIRKLWRLYQHDPDASDDDLGSFPEYGLCFDYVPKGTFNDQKRGYFRWQLSWGGPSDEFRFYTDECFDLIAIEYWFLDWFDGAKTNVDGDDYTLLDEIFQDFKEIGVIENEYQKAY